MKTGLVVEYLPAPAQWLAAVLEESFAGIRVDVASSLAEARAILEKRSPVYPNKVSTDLPDIWPEWEEPEFR